MPFLPSVDPPTASDKDCAICHDPLLVPSSDHGQPSYLIDDVEFCCKHHFHWVCILDYSVSSHDARNRCALCRHSVLNSQGEFIVQVRNEGGTTNRFDFGREIDQHLFFKTNPRAEREFKFLSLMSQMDFSDAELLLKGEDPDATERLNPDVCYDSGGITAMHMAATNDDVEGVQLLLKYGADKDFRSEDGQTALDMAKAEGSKQVVALLSAESEE